MHILVLNIESTIFFTFFVIRITGYQGKVRQALRKLMKYTKTSSKSKPLNSSSTTNHPHLGMITLSKTDEIANVSSLITGARDSHLLFIML